MDLNPTSLHFFRHETLSLLKPGALLVNVARGELVDTSAAQDALAEGRLAGLGLDVFQEENRVADALRGLVPRHPEAERLLELARHPGVIMTPHNAFTCWRPWSAQKRVERAEGRTSFGAMARLLLAVAR